MGAFMNLGKKSGWFRHISALAALGALAAAVPANAGTSEMGAIKGVLPHEGGFFFNAIGTRNAAPACATVTMRWVINTATSQGQAMVAGLLSATWLASE
jgi:hypothetical protein